MSKLKLTLPSLSDPSALRVSARQADTPANGNNANGNNAFDGELPTVPADGTLPSGAPPRSETRSRKTNDQNANASGVSSTNNVRVVGGGDEERRPLTPSRNNEKTSGDAGHSSGVSNRSRARVGGGGGEVGASSAPAGQVRQRRHRGGVGGEEGSRDEGFDDLAMSPAEEQREAKAVEVREGSTPGADRSSTDRS